MNPIVSNGNKLKWKFQNIKDTTEKDLFSDKFLIGSIDWRIVIHTEMVKDIKYRRICLSYDSDNKNDKNWICKVQDGKYRRFYEADNYDNDGFNLKIEHLNSNELEWECCEFWNYEDYYNEKSEDAIIVEVEFNFKYYDFSKQIPNFTDIRINVENTEFHVNKWALGSRSQYFYDLFIKDENQTTKSMNLDDVKPEDFCLMLALFYPYFEYDLTYHGHEKLIELAKKFDVACFHYKCEQYLLGCKWMENNIKIEHADENDYKQLMDQCISSLKSVKDIQTLHASAQFSKFKKTTKLRIMRRLLDFVHVDQEEDDDQDW